MIFVVHQSRTQISSPINFHRIISYDMVYCVTPYQVLLDRRGVPRTMVAITDPRWEIPLPDRVDERFSKESFERSEHLLAICERCLERDPVERPSVSCALDFSKKLLAADSVAARQLREEEEGEMGEGQYLGGNMRNLWHPCEKSVLQT